MDEQILTSLSAEVDPSRTELVDRFSALVGGALPDGLRPVRSRDPTTPRLRTSYVQAGEAPPSWRRRAGEHIARCVMRRILGMIGAAATAIVMLVPSAGTVSASFGHASIGGYEHSGYEYS